VPTDAQQGAQEGRAGEPRAQRNAEDRSTASLRDAVAGPLMGGTISLLPADAPEAGHNVKMRIIAQHRQAVLDGEGRYPRVICRNGLSRSL